jgi:transcriptional regulator with XRE-family HTH domain
MPPRVTPVDRGIGARVKQRRQSLGMSQTKLGEKIGVTFQQVQKYETGASRISAGRLASIASTLDVPITFFFDGLKAAADSPDEEDALVLALRDEMTLELVKAFAAIPDPALRRRVVDFVRAASGSEREEPAAAPPVTGIRTRKSAGDGVGRKRR